MTILMRLPWTMMFWTGWQTIRVWLRDSKSMIPPSSSRVQVCTKGWQARVELICQLEEKIFYLLPHKLGNQNMMKIASNWRKVIQPTERPSQFNSLLHRQEATWRPKSRCLSRIRQPISLWELRKNIQVEGVSFLKIMTRMVRKMVTISREQSHTKIRKEMSPQSSQIQDSRNTAKSLRICWNRTK